MDKLALILTFGPMTLFLVVLFFSTINAGFLLIAEKWNLLKLYDLYRRRWMPARCEFCACFWLSVIELGTWYKFYHVGPADFAACSMLLAFALCSAVASRFFLK